MKKKSDPLSSYFSRNMLLENVKSDMRQLHFQFLKLSSIDVENNYWYQEHIRYYIEIVIPREDSYRCRVNGEELLIDPGQALIVQAGDRHEDFYRAGSKLTFIQLVAVGAFGKSSPSHIFKQRTPAESKVVDLSESPSAQVILNLITNHKQDNSYREIILEKLCETFFWELIDLIPDSYLDQEFITATGQNAIIRRLNEYFQERINTKLNIGKLATELGMSRRTLEIKFFQWFGDSPSNTFIRLKMQTAASMIKSGLSIKETAEQLGYTDQFYFSTVFKRVMGTAPSKLI